MTHKPVKFATFKALRNISALSPEPDAGGENCVNFGAAKGSRGRRINPVICVNFGLVFCKKARVICVNFAADLLLRQARS